MLCVLVLIGIMAVLITDGLQHSLSRTRSDQAVQAIANTLRHCRIQAIADGKSVDFRFNPRTLSYRQGLAASTSIPPDMQVQMRYAQSQHLVQRDGLIRFYPDGSSSGGQLWLRSGPRHWRIDVMWLSGTVYLHHGEVSR